MWKYVFVAGALLCQTATLALGANHPKVLIIYDMEGVSGVIHPDYTRFVKQEEYAIGRKSLTSDVNAAIRGLVAGGAASIWVQDGHSSGNVNEPDILLNEMDPRAKMDFRPVSYNPYTTGIDGSIDAIACVGMHARAGTEGFEPHTVNFEITLKVNNVEFTETHIVALSAARFGIPVIMVSGDNVLREQLRADFPDMEYATVKTAHSRGSAEPFPATEVNQRIETAAHRAMQKFLDGKFRPYYLSPPYTFVVGFRNSEEAAQAARDPMVEHAGETSVRYTNTSFVEGYRTGSRIFQEGNDRLAVLERLLNETPEGRKILDEWTESFWQRFIDDTKAPAWSKQPLSSRPQQNTNRQFFGDR
jgi:D-amino peptidase